MLMFMQVIVREGGREGERERERNYITSNGNRMVVIHLEYSFCSKNQDP